MNLIFVLSWDDINTFFFFTALFTGSASTRTVLVTAWWRRDLCGYDIRGSPKWGRFRIRRITAQKQKFIHVTSNLNCTYTWTYNVFVFLWRKQEVKFSYDRYAIPDGTGHICGFLGGSCGRTSGSVSGVRQVRSFRDGGGSFCCSLTRRSFCWW